MTRLFLTAKHWQIFILLFIAPLLLYFKTISSMDEGWTSYPPLTVAPESDFFRYFPLLLLICSLCVAGWYWSIVIGIHKKVKSTLKSKLWLFKLSFIVPIVGVILFFHGLPYSMMLGTNEVGDYSINSISSTLDFINQFTIVAVACFLYILWMTAKTLRLAELKRELILKDYMTALFLLLCYPIGVWWIQPRVNKIIEE